MSKTVLVVDDSMYMRKTIKDALVEAGYEVIGEAANGEAAIDMALDLQPDLVTLDNMLPDMIGLDILEVYNAEQLKSKVVVISAVAQQSVIQRGLDLGASEYIVKPFTTEQLIEATEKALA